MGSVKNLLFWKKVTSVIGLFAIINSMIVSAPLAQAQTPPISAVSAVDNDTTFFGVDGNDFFVSWTAGSQPDGFTQNRVYIVPNATSLTASDVDTNGCGGSACTSLMFFDFWNMQSATLPPFHPGDSEGTAWNAATSYKACVVTSATANSITCSSAFSVTSDSVTDDDAPFIDHKPVHTMINDGSSNVLIYALIDDEQTAAAAFNNTSDGGAEYFKLKYLKDSNWNTALDGVQVNGGLSKFTIPFADIPAVSSTFKYYLLASDADANTDVICADYTAATEAACQSAPFIANVVDGATVVNASGTIKDFSDANVESATVIAGGLAAPSGVVGTTAANGTYTITGVPASNGYDFAAYKSGFCESFRFEIVGGSNKTGVDMFINNNECFNDTSTPGGGGSDKPFVMESIPWPGQSNISPSVTPVVFMSQSMDATTVNDADATGANDKIYLTSDDGTTKVAGQAIFCADSSVGGCSAIGAGKTNAIVFDPTADLPAGMYTLVLKQNVLSSGGKSIDGNRSGGGHEINFSIGGGTFSAGDLSTNFGQSGAYMPPYVKNVVPQPGFTAPTNTKINLEFNDALDSSTVTSSSIQLLNSSNTAVTATNTLSTDGKRLTIAPATSLAAGEYRVVVKGSVANVNGVTMRDGANLASNAFESFVTIGSSSDTTAPTVYPFIANNGTLAVNEPLRFGFSEGMDESTLTFSSGGITLKRGNTNVSASVVYDPGSFELTVQPNDVLPPNTAVTVQFVNPTVKDLAGNAIAAGTAFNYTTGGLDTTAPAVNGGSGCDDYKCRISFTEPMEYDSQTGADYNSSVLKPGNFALVVDGSSVDLGAAGVNFTYNSNGVDINGLNLSAKINTQFTMTITGVKDLSGNAIATSNEQNIVRGKIENSSNTFGSFGGDMGGGMFGPPTAGGGTVGGEFKAGGGDQIGGFAMGDFFGGSATMAFPFNNMAGVDSDVFQIRFSPGAVLQDGDQVKITFPTGTGVTNAVQDSWSPFKSDFNEEWGSGTVTFDSTFDTDGIAVNAASRKVTVQLDITGTPGANDFYTIDLKGITNPSIPKGPSTAGYTVGVQVVRGSTEISSSTSMPFFTGEAGSNTINVSVFAGSQGSPANVAGDIYTNGWGPAGSMNRKVTLAAGIISKVNDVTASNISYGSLPDGCYNIGTEPFVTLGGTDYFGQEFSEPVCVDGGETVAHNIVLANASSTAGATVTVKLAGIADFGSADLEIFAGGPGKFVVKSLSGLDAPDPDGYTLKLPANGHWMVGVGPGMPKGGSSMSMPKPLPGVPPSPMELRVSNIDTTPVVKPGFQPGQGATFDDSTDTITFTFVTANKTVTGTVKDASGNGLSKVDIGMHSQGFGMGTWTQTANDGTFTLNVSALGSYELNANKWGLPPANVLIEIRADGADAGTDPDIYYKGKQITGANPLVIKMKKDDYSISGKVLDLSGSAIARAPVKASDADGSVRFGGSDSTGNYTMFVGAGTWTVTAELPPDKTAECGTYSKTVTITNESKSSQNLEPGAATCYTLSGTITMAGNPMANGPVMIEEWDSVNNRPSGGVFRPTSTNSSGEYEAKVAGSKTYRVATWDPTYGELSDTVSVATSNATKNLTSGSAASNTFTFAGLDADKLDGMEGFIELENTTTGERKYENIKDLSESKVVRGIGDEFKYRLNIYGVGDFAGTITAGATEAIDLSSTVTDYVTYSGTVTDGDGDPLKNAVVTLDSTTSNVVRTVVTDANGDFSVDVRDGTYEVSTSLGNHIPSARTAVTLSADSADNDTSLVEADSTIKGTIYKFDGSTPADSGFVTAVNSTTGAKITVPIDKSDGTYDIPVTDGTWEVTAGGPAGHAKTDLSGTVTVSGADDTGNNITLSADATKTVSSASKAVPASTGGTVDDTANTGVKLTAGSGVLSADTDANVTVKVEKNYTAGDTTNNLTLGNTGFEITANDGSTEVGDLVGQANIQIDYTSMLADLPAGASESDLKLAYFSTEKGEYVPVEGGYTVDATNNVVTANTTHFTTFALVVPASSTSSGGGVSGAVSYYPQDERTVVDGEEVAVESGAEGDEEVVTEEECVVEAVEGAEDEASAEAAATECLPASDSEGDIADVEEEKSYVEVDEEANTVTYFVPPADTYEVSFADIGKHWSSDVVSDLAGRGIVEGFQVGNQIQFKPDQGMTRAELVKAVVRAMELPVPLSVKGADLGYYDVKSDSQYAPYIYAAQKVGIVDRGLLFRPNAVVNRAEALKVVLNAAKVDLADYPDGMLLPFGDVERHAWFRNHLKYAFYHGIIGGYVKNGKREFRGANTVTRAEASKMISEVFKFEDKKSIGDMLKAALFGLFR